MEIQKNSPECLYVGGRIGCLEYLQGRSGYYTYVLRRPDGRPFYVGKGIGPRVFGHENEARHPNDRRSNAHKLNVIRAIWKAAGEVTYEIDRVFETEIDAYAREEHLISKFGRLHQNGPLTNRAPGGGSSEGISPFSRQKHAATLGGMPEDDPETAVLNRFVLAIGTIKSVVLKPASRFIMKPTQAYPAKLVSKTLRQAIALAASAAANGITIEGGCVLPRTVCIDGVDGFVENGVTCDFATSGMAHVHSSSSPAQELISLSDAQARTVIGFLGAAKCVTLGIVADDYLTKLAHRI